MKDIDRKETLFSDAKEQERIDLENGFVKHGYTQQRRKMGFNEGGCKITYRVSINKGLGFN